VRAFDSTLAIVSVQAHIRASSQTVGTFAWSPHQRNNQLAGDESRIASLFNLSQRFMPNDEVLLASGGFPIDTAIYFGVSPVKRNPHNSNENLVPRRLRERHINKTSGAFLARDDHPGFH
jgi:hypothetical protein